jgi:2-polyprenyl-3-methyl-5-hydroxy-6-metoxy-1,4-benzoquinol methylase
MPSYFDAAYRDYWLQNPAKKLDHYLDQIDSLVGNSQVALLDIGCGLGAFLERANGRHPDWTFAATDVDAEAVAEAARRVPGANIIQGSAADVLFEEDTFDVVTAWDVLEHVRDLDAAADAVQRMLKPGGLLVFVVPVYDGLSGPLIRRLDTDPTHIHKLARKEWIAWARESFDHVEWHGLFRYLVGATYVHASTRWARGHAPAILASCRRP